MPDVAHVVVNPGEAGGYRVLGTIEPAPEGGWIAAPFGSPPRHFDTAAEAEQHVREQA
jgi:hypothetical protein